MTTLTAALILVNGLLAEAILVRQGRLAGLAVLFGLALHGLGWGLMQTELNPPGLNSPQTKPVRFVHTAVPRPFRRHRSGQHSYPTEAVKRGR